VLHQLRLRVRFPIVTLPLTVAAALEGRSPQLETVRHAITRMIIKPARYKIFLNITTLPLIGINFADYNQQ
jgi:hypothetical protein